MRGCSTPSIARFRSRSRATDVSEELLFMGRTSKVVYAVSIWSIASALSNGETGTSPGAFASEHDTESEPNMPVPQSMMSDPCTYGLLFHASVQPRIERWRLLPERIAYGPKRAPGPAQVVRDCEACGRSALTEGDSRVERQAKNGNVERAAGLFNATRVGQMCKREWARERLVNLAAVLVQPGLFRHA
jgi:hypothetical protein